MIQFKQLEKKSSANSHQEVLTDELLHLGLSIRLLFSKYSVPDKTSKELLLSLTEFKEKEAYVIFVKNTLLYSDFSNSRVNDVLSELRWLLRENNFRWRFEAFDMHNVKMTDILE